jgi:GTPase Era involved in 16S rRNA processing
MVIGKGGSMIKEISMASRKELETATSKKVYIDLTAETDIHRLEFLK